ncbi:MAG TPA: hypothetical protein VI248_01795 [Kineosporiaceae bacterium]
MPTVPSDEATGAAVDGGEFDEAVMADGPVDAGEIMAFGVAGGVLDLV